MEIANLVRKNILQLKPYSSARDEFKGEAEVYLDANENPYPSEYNRYPDPLQKKLKLQIGQLKGVNPEQLFLGNGSDEAIDLLIRVFCEPEKDSVIITEPTYGMYAVCAGVNNVTVKSVSLTPNFQLDVNAIFKVIDTHTKLIFLCSPNNPSGNLMKISDIVRLLDQFKGIVVLDEAYIDFTDATSFVTRLNDYENLVVLQTFSKAWGLAGLRLGLCYANETIIDLLNKIKYPYNINSITQKIVGQQLQKVSQKNLWVNEIIQERRVLEKKLATLPLVLQVFSSDANFLLVRFRDAKHIYTLLLEKRIIVRDRSNVLLCNNCLRITVGTPAENQALLNSLKEI